MSELYLQAPSEDLLSAEYTGVSFEAFKQLDDAAIEELRGVAQEEWLAACAQTEGFSDEWFAAKQKVSIFNSFLKWRQHGVPDRDMTDTEFMERMYHYADSRCVRDPEYGQFPETEFNKLSDSEQKLTTFILTEVWKDGMNCVGQPTVEIGGDTYQVAERLHVSHSDLVEKGVLETYETQETVMFDRGSGYVLTNKYSDYLLNERYRMSQVYKSSF